jgi:hypothetical protein
MATSITHWTVEELAVFCEHCMVIAVAEDDRYCLDCANDVCEYLVVWDAEQQCIENGWY